VRHRPSPIPASRSWLALSVVAAALLLVVPVTARAGGEAPHAHALVHLLVDGADGRLDHHHHHHHPSGHADAPHAGDVSVQPDGRAAQFDPPTPARRSAPDADEDVPTVTTASSAAAAALIAATLPAAATSVLVVVRRRDAWPGIAVPVTHTVVPESPPPRPVA